MTAFISRGDVPRPDQQSTPVELVVRRNIVNWTDPD